MAGIPVAFGAFAGGLWGGATQMMNLATTYQQYQQNEMALNEMRQGIAARDAARDKQAAAEAGQAPPTIVPDQEQKPDQPAQQPAQPVAPATTPATVTKPAPATMPDAVTKPTTTPDRRTATPVVPTTAAPTTTVQPGPAVPTQEEQAGGTGLPLSGTPAPPKVAAVPMVPSAPTAPAPEGVPVQPSQPAQPAQDMSNRGRTPGLVTVPQPQPQPPFNAAGVAGAPGTPSGPAQTSAQRNPPLLPWPAPQATPQAPAQAAPAAPATPPAGSPGLAVSPALVSQNQPQGGGVLGAIGRVLMPSAAAAEPAPGQGITLATPTSQTAGQAAAAQPHPDASKPATAAATPVLPAQPAPAAPAPTRATPSAAPVVRDQQGPTVQAQQPAAGPSVLQVDPIPWHTIQLKDPALADAIKYAVDRYGHGQISYEEMAAVKVRETGYNSDARTIQDGDGGASYGAMQVQPGTFAKASGGRQPIGDFDPHTLQGSLNQAAVVFAHLGSEVGYGAHTVQMQYAYARGETKANRAAVSGWDNEAKLEPKGVAAVQMLYPGTRITSANIPGAFAAGVDRRVLMADMTRGGAAGPDGALTTLAKYTPAGLGLDNAWRTAQAHFEMYAMIKGNFNAIPMIQNYFAGLSHQGALSNLSSGYTALVAGDTKTAAQYFAKAYAFFPDGVEGRLAIDGKGQLWAQRFDSGHQMPMGAPFQLTPEAVAAKITELGTDPRNFLSTFQNYLKSAAETRYYNAHADYMEKMPQVREEMNQIRLQAEQDKEAARQDALAAKQEAAGLKNDQVRAIDADIGKRYGPASGEGGTLTKPDEVAPRDWAVQSEVAKGLQYPSHSGGANLGAPMADTLAGDIRSGHAQFQGFMGKDRQGRPVPNFAIWGEGKDPKKDQPDAEVSFEIGNRFLRMAPGNKVENGSVGGMPTNQPQPDPRKNAAVGAGAGSPMVAMGGGFNLAGPVMNQQQQQPQPSSVG